MPFRLKCLYILYQVIVKKFGLKTLYIYIFIYSKLFWVSDYSFKLFRGKYTDIKYNKYSNKKKLFNLMKIFEMSNFFFPK